MSNIQEMPEGLPGRLTYVKNTAYKSQRHMLSELGLKKSHAWMSRAMSGDSPTATMELAYALAYNGWSEDWLMTGEGPRRQDELDEAKGGVSRPDEDESVFTGNITGEHAGKSLRDVERSPMMEGHGLNYSSTRSYLQQKLAKMELRSNEHPPRYVRSTEDSVVRRDGTPVYRNVQIREYWVAPSDLHLSDPEPDATSVPSNQ